MQFDPSTGGLCSPIISWFLPICIAPYTQVHNVVEVRLVRVSVVWRLGDHEMVERPLDEGRVCVFFFVSRVLQYR